MATFWWACWVHFGDDNKSQSKCWFVIIFLGGSCRAAFPFPLSPLRPIFSPPELLLRLSCDHACAHVGNIKGWATRSCRDRQSRLMWRRCRSPPPIRHQQINEYGIYPRRELGEGEDWWSTFHYTDDCLEDDGTWKMFLPYFNGLISSSSPLFWIITNTVNTYLFAFLYSLILPKYHTDDALNPIALY